MRSRAVSQFGADIRGTVAIIFALSAFVLILAVGLAVDGARAYNISARVNAALDAAALAAAKMLDDENNTDAMIQDRAKRFFAAHFADTPVSGVTIPEPSITIRRSQGEVILKVNVSVKSTFAQLAGIPAFNFPRASQAKFDQKLIELALALDLTGSMCAPCSKIDGLKSAARTLIENVITPQTPYGNVRVALAPYSAAVNAGSFADAVSGGLSRDGCVVERPGVENDTDIPPDGANALGTSSSRLNPRYSCPRSTIAPLSPDSATLLAQIDRLSTGGFTAGHVGLAWAWYLISHKWNSIWPTESRPHSPTPNVIKAVLLMTDGEFNTSYMSQGKNSTNILTADSSPDQASKLCTNMKAEGIIVYTVAFQAPPAALDLLSSCATSRSHFFPTSSNTELVSAFRTIAERLTALRITGS